MRLLQSFRRILKVLLSILACLSLVQWRWATLAPVGSTSPRAGRPLPLPAEAAAPCGTASALQLLRPWHHFDSNSWFHVAEYFAPHLVSAAAAARPPGCAVVYILTQDPEFVTGLSRMTAMLMRLFLVDDLAATVVYVEPGRVWRTSNQICFDVAGRVYVDEPGRRGPGLHAVGAAAAYAYTGAHTGAYTDSDADAAAEAGRRGERGALCRLFGCLGPAPRAVSVCTSEPLPPVGRMPTDRGKWFNGSGAVAVLRQRVRSMLSLASRAVGEGDAGGGPRRRFPAALLNEPDGVPSGLYRYDRDTDNLLGIEQIARNISRRQGPTLLVFLRDLNRKFVDCHGVLRRVGRALGRSRADTKTAFGIEVLQNHDDLPPPLVMGAFWGADVLLTAHGFQVSGLLFMRPASLVIEIFPYNYFRIGYKHLAAEVAVKHRWLQNLSPYFYGLQLMRLIPQERCMRMPRCRHYARRDNIVLSDSDVNAVARWSADIAAL